MANDYFVNNRHRGKAAVEERFAKLGKVSKLLDERSDQLATLITTEMGKPFN